MSMTNELVEILISSPEIIQWADIILWDSKITRKDDLNMLKIGQNKGQGDRSIDLSISF